MGRSAPSYMLSTMSHIRHVGVRAPRGWREHSAIRARVESGEQWWRFTDAIIGQHSLRPYECAWLSILRPRVLSFCNSNASRFIASIENAMHRVATPEDLFLSPLRSPHVAPVIENILDSWTLERNPCQK